MIFWWKLALALAIGKPFFEVTESILRNPVTDRCLHLGSNRNRKIIQDINEIKVYADQCTFTDAETGKDGNSDQWLHIVPVKNHMKSTEHTIQKYFSDNILCVQTVEDFITVGDCISQNSIFMFKPLQYLPSSSGQLFTVEQPSGKCLTIQPGNQRLGLNNCSDTNPFQRWVACRHIRACDIEISWNPSRIVFPKDPFNLTSDFQESTERNFKIPTPSTPLPNFKVVEKVPEVTSDVLDKTIDSKGKVILNEPIYFIYNSLKIINQSEKELTEIVSKFYSVDELEKALEILHSEFSLEIDPRSGVPMTKQAVELINWIKEISTNSLNYNVIFASENLARVPPVSCKFFETKPQVGKMHCACASPSVTKNKIETNMNLIIEKLSSFKREIMSDIDQYVCNSTSSSSTSNPLLELSSEVEDISSDEIMNIDIRINPSKKHLNPQMRNEFNSKK